MESCHSWQYRLKGSVWSKLGLNDRVGHLTTLAEINSLGRANFKSVSQDPKAIHTGSNNHYNRNYF